MTSAPGRVRFLFVTSMVLVLTGPIMLTVANSKAMFYALAFAAVQISTSAVGALVASRQPTNAVGWVLLAIGWALGFSNTASAYGNLGTTTSDSRLPADEIATWVGSWTFVPIVFGGVMALLYVFPDGHVMSRLWRRIGLVSVVILGWATFNDALLPGHMDDASGILNPIPATGWLADIILSTQGVTNLLALPVFGCGVAAVVVRFRRSRGIERLQLKWISTAMVFVGLSLGLTASTHGALGQSMFFIALFALAAMPVAIGVAVLRYRLYDIDVVINRTLVYGALTATLAAVYLGSVLLLQLALNRFTEGSSLAIAVSTLAVAALFRPARARIQDAVDRRFFRHKYDAGRTLDHFATHMRNQVDLAGIGNDLLAVVGDTVQPAHASLWLRTQGSRS